MVFLGSSLFFLGLRFSSLGLPRPYRGIIWRIFPYSLKVYFSFVFFVVGFSL